MRVRIKGHLAGAWGPCRKSKSCSSTPADTTAPGFTGPVYVSTGQRDTVFCVPTIPLVGTPDCGSGAGSLLDRTRQLFPATTNYGYYAVPNTGHDVNTHYKAHDACVRTYEFLNSAGF
ncbi:hypothetical protein PWT90_04379 [Aphanocladium album]|nr:hypothetical protein PWT90_04379 [Aphanocladium album]